MAKIQLWEAIESLNKNAKYQYSHDKDDATVELIDTIKWTDGTTPISNADIQAEMDRLQVEHDAQDYARNREAEYPHLREFAEAYTEKEIGGDSTKWDAYIINYNKVRTENPK